VIASLIRCHAVRPPIANAPTRDRCAEVQVEKVAWRVFTLHAGDELLLRLVEIALRTGDIEIVINAVPQLMQMSRPNRTTLGGEIIECGSIQSISHFQECNPELRTKVATLAALLFGFISFHGFSPLLRF
jgi:hypothetical protein